MCIIAAKPAGVKMPDADIIENMWYANRDGAGLMYVKDGKVRIEKGFMALAALTTRLDALQKDINLNKAPVVMHFRITTHGGTKPENCHPFPITDNIGALKKLTQNVPIGVAHNGIIHNIPRKGISDTMEYIASQLAPLSKALPRFYENKHAMTLIKNAIESKMAILTGEGKIYTIGKFTKDKGVLYSNDSFRDYYGYRSIDWGSYGDYGGYGMADTTPPFKAETRMLMWLEDAGSYVIDNEGGLAEGEDFLIDSKNRVYLYDWDHDGAIYCPGCQAYNPQSMPARFDYEQADAVYILDEIMGEHEDKGNDYAY